MHTRGELVETTRPRRMSRRDKRAWRAPVDLEGLGEVTAQWLEGRIESHPNGHYGGPDSETDEIRDALIALNRAGLVTDCSQPGQTPESEGDGEDWWQRAAVYGFATPAFDAWTREVEVAHPDLIVVRHRGADRRWFPRLRGLFQSSPGTAVPCTRWNGRVHTAFGSHMHASDIGLCFDPTSDEAYDTLCSAVQLTVIDSEWGRKDYLWAALVPPSGRL